LISIKYLNLWTEQKIAPDLVSYLEKKVPVPIRLARPELSRRIITRPDFLKQLAACRLINHQQSEPLNPYKIELEQEKKFLQENRLPPFVYEANWLANFYQSLVSPGLPRPAIVLTNRRIATFGDDGRYHLRYALYGYVTIISLSGIEQAPARSQKYYQLKLLDPLLAKKLSNDQLTKKEFYQTVANLFWQALFYYFTGNPFCENKNCLLYNFHWYRELKNILQKNKLCPNHQRLAKKFFAGK